MNLLAELGTYNFNNMKALKFVFLFLPFTATSQTAYYAFLDGMNKVTQVITGIDGEINGMDAEVWYGLFRNQICKKTDITGVYRKNYAGIGYTYDWQLDCFIAPKPFASWVLNTQTCRYEAPVPYPNNGNFYYWDEQTQTWKPEN